MKRDMNKHDKEKFLVWLMESGWLPMMIMKNVANGFWMVPFKHLYTLSYNSGASSWPYSFVNKSKKDYKMTFTSLDELVDVVFEAEEIWHGSDKTANKCFNKREEMLVRWDLDTAE